MPRYALKIEYDGRPFAGWQWQDAQPSVQGAVQAALARIAPEAPKLTGAGRTDAGVHALGQVAHVDLARAWEPERLAAAVNAHLRPAPVAVVAAAEVDATFHARFDAVEREYLFRLVSRRAPLVHDRGFAWRVGHRLDLAAMREGAAALIGRHDFTTFRSSTCQAKSPVRTLDEIEIEETAAPGGREYRFRLRARSFLHNQVRGIVGTLGTSRTRRLATGAGRSGACRPRPVGLRAGLSAGRTLSHGGAVSARPVCRGRRGRQRRSLTEPCPSGSGLIG